MKKKYIALYGRFSTDIQNPDSAEDQIVDCRDHVIRLGLDDGSYIFKEYVDDAVTGRHMKRDGIQELLTDIKAGLVAYVVAESLSRLSRSLADIAKFYEIARFYDVTILTLSEAKVGAIHIALKGCMNAQHLIDSGRQINRGKKGSASKGKIPGGNTPYGYRIVKLNKEGLPERGLREIVPEEAEVVKKVYKRFLSGKSRADICRELNGNKVPTRSGGKWTSNSLCSWDPPRGILRNPIYKGLIVVFRATTKINPDTGKPITVMGDPSEVVENYQSHLRMVSDEMWDAAQKIALETYKAYEKAKPVPKLNYKVICMKCMQKMTRLKAQSLVCRLSRKSGGTVKSGSPCEPKSVNIKALEALIVKTIREDTRRIWKSWLTGLRFQMTVKGELIRKSDTIKTELERAKERSVKYPDEQEYNQKKIGRIQYKLAKRRSQLEALAVFPESYNLDYDKFLKFLSTATDDEVIGLVDEVAAGFEDDSRDLTFDNLLPNWQMLKDISTAAFPIKFRKQTWNSNLPQINLN
jgi:DNA invertase Pin-like site-specific DNA recombinase